MVRVATHDSSMRALIKEMSGQVQDIAFAHNYNTVILACVDEEGSLFVYNIEEKTDNLVYPFIYCSHITKYICCDTVLRNVDDH